MKEILDAILNSDSLTDDLAAIPLPTAYRAVTLHRDEEHMFDGTDASDRDPRKSLHVEEVPVPELGLGEALVAVMASAVNYNTVWSSIFSPISTFAFLRRYGKLSPPPPPGAPSGRGWAPGPRGGGGWRGERGGGGGGEKRNPPGLLEWGGL